MRMFDKTRLEADYDERQVAARGQAYRRAYFTLLISLLVYLCSEGLFGMWCDAAAGAGICVCLSAGVFAVSCIVNDAYRRLNERPRSIILVSGSLAAVNLAIAALHIAHGEMMENGILSFRVNNLAVGVMGAVILAAYLVRLNAVRKEREEE